MSVLFTRRGTAPTVLHGLPVSDLAVGSTVWMKINGVRFDFTVVNQGNPNSSIYDSSCDGTWLLMTDIVFADQKNPTTDGTSAFEDTYIFSYLNNDFFDLFDGCLQNAIKEVKLPYLVGGDVTALATLSSGLSARIFLLSCPEVGFTGSTIRGDGACLSYFTSGSAGNSSRIKSHWVAGDYIWHLRSPYNASYGTMVSRTGTHDFGNMHLQYGMCPAMVLSFDTVYDPETNEILGVASAPDTDTDGKVTVAILGCDVYPDTGYTNYRYITVNGTKHQIAANLQVSPGTPINIHGGSYSNNVTVGNSYLYINDNLIAKSSGASNDPDINYDFTVVSDTVITFMGSYIEIREGE